MGIHSCVSGRMVPWMLNETTASATRVYIIGARVMRYVPCMTEVYKEMTSHKAAEDEYVQL